MKTEDESQWIHYKSTVTKENLAKTTKKQARLWHHVTIKIAHKAIGEHRVWPVKFINLDEWHKYIIHLHCAHTLNTASLYFVFDS
jgi:hypothetical protein